MKKRLWILVATFILAGCSGNINTAKVRAALPSVSGDEKAQLEIALSDIDSGKFKGALLPLRNVAVHAKLPPKEAEVLNDTMEKVKAKAATQ